MPGFFVTTARLCMGTKIYPEIYNSSPVRAVFRLVLLILLCSIAASVISTMIDRGSFRRAGEGLNEEIGALVVREDGICFAKNPETPRRLKLPYVVLEYFPGSTFVRESFNDEDVQSDFGLIVLTRGVVTWARIPWKGETVYNASFLPVDVLYKSLHGGSDSAVIKSTMDSPWAFYSGAGLAEKIKEAFASDSAVLPDGSEETSVSLSGSELAGYALSTLAAVKFLMVLCRNIFEIGILILLVALVQYLRASTLPKNLKFKNVLTLMVYSAFVPLILASLFDAAGGGRYVSFQIFFICSYFISQMLAYGAVIRFLYPKKGDGGGHSDDMDF